MRPAEAPKCDSVRGESSPERWPAVCLASLYPSHLGVGSFIIRIPFDDAPLE